MTQSHCFWDTPKGIKVSAQQRHLFAPVLVGALLISYRLSFGVQQTDG